MEVPDTILDARDALELIDGILVKPEGDDSSAAELNRWKKANKIAKEIFSHNTGQETTVISYELRNSTRYVGKVEHL